MIEFYSIFVILYFINCEDRAMLKSNPSARLMPKHTEGENSPSYILLGDALAGNAINFGVWGRAPIPFFVLPVRHMSRSSGFDNWWVFTSIPRVDLNSGQHGAL